MKRYLFLDSGNTRLKHSWASVSEDGAVSWAHAPSLDQALWASDPAAVQQAMAAHRPAAHSAAAVWGVNVAGPAIAEHLGRLLHNLDLPPVSWLQPAQSAYGVTSGYDNPLQLGADRWASLIGARARHPDEHVLIASFGTATTIDTLRADGYFLGGVILPGLSLMQESLHRHTAQLPAVSGMVVPMPRSTQDAIASGCLAAQLGALAVQRLHALEALGEEPRVLLSGGAAARIAAALAYAAEPADHLVMEGLLRAAHSETNPAP